jgi:hypothetical protein
MSINQAFLGHGIFTQYSVTDALACYSDYESPNSHPAPKDAIDRFIFAIQDMQISSVWIQLFTSRAKNNGDVEPNKDGRQKREELIARLQAANINWAGWGYCASRCQERDLPQIEAYRSDLKMKAFVINSEPLKGKDEWSIVDFEKFSKAVKDMFGRENVALSTWPVLQLQDEKNNPVIEIMRKAEPHVCLFAPQAYFMSFPNHYHYDQGFDKKEFPPNDPVSYVRLVIEAWRRLKFTNPLVISGQAYWGEEGNPPQKTMEKKVKQFATKFADEDWGRIIGFNWYHAGKPKTENEQAISDQMIKSISKAKLGSKPYGSA